MKLFISFFFILISLSFGFAQTKPETPQTSTALDEAQKLNTEVVKLFSQQKYDEALPLALKVIEIQERELSKFHLALAMSWRNLGYIQKKRDKKSEAEKAFKKAIEVFEKNRPLTTENEKLYADVLDVVAFDSAIEGKLETAEKMFRVSLEIRERLFGKDSLEAANMLYRLGDVYQAQEEFEKAEPLLLRSLDIFSAKLGINDSKTRFLFHNCTCVLSKLNKTEEVKSLESKFYPNLGSGTSKTINGGVVNGIAVFLSKPAYPEKAKESRSNGEVQVLVLISETGEIIQACAIKGPKVFYKVAEKAAYQSRFTPTSIYGKTVQVRGIIIYRFNP